MASIDDFLSRMGVVPEVFIVSELRGRYLLLFGQLIPFFLGSWNVVAFIPSNFIVSKNNGCFLDMRREFAPAILVVGTLVYNILNDGLIVAKRIVKGVADLLSMTRLVVDLNESTASK